MYYRITRSFPKDYETKLTVIVIFVSLYAVELNLILRVNRKKRAMVKKLKKKVQRKRENNKPVRKEYDDIRQKINSSLTIKEKGTIS